MEMNMMDSILISNNNVFLIFSFLFSIFLYSPLVLHLLYFFVRKPLCKIGCAQWVYRRSCFFFLFSLFNSESFFSKVFWMIVFFFRFAFFIHSCIACLFTPLHIFFISHFPHRLHTTQVSLVFYVFKVTVNV